MKSDAGREVLGTLIARTDVLVQNFRHGTMERLGFGPEQLRQRDPRLIYASISGFADIESQAVTNRPQMIRTILADKTTSIFTAQAVSSAVYGREKTGQGDHIQVAMLDVMISYVWPEGMAQYT